MITANFKGSLAVIALVTAVAACQTSRVVLPPPPEEPAIIFDKPICTSCGWLLTKSHIDTLTKLAADGSSTAAFRLALHYSSADNDQQNKIWMLRAAELGHPIAQYNVWFSLHDSTSCADQLNALSWLEKSAGKGFHAAIQKLPDSRKSSSHCQAESK